jgi:hypothetical protein
MPVHFSLLPAQLEIAWPAEMVIGPAFVALLAAAAVGLFASHALGPTAVAPPADHEALAEGDEKATVAA